MSKNLVIVESPSKAKTIKNILGSNYEVLASVGHVIDLPKKKIGIDIKNDFKPQYEIISDKKDILDNLKSKAKKADKVYLASDLDREGEAIAWHISNYIDQGDKVRRIEFNEITKTAIFNAVKHPRKINQDLVDSQQARRLLDRIVGYKISPLLWPMVGKNASAGRVQSVALKLICELEDEIKNFVSQKYFELGILIEKNISLDLYQINDEKIDKIYDEAVFNKSVKDIKDKEVLITELKTSKKTQKPPVVFKTSTLQQLASSYLGYNATKTMRIAQKLYEGIDVNGETKGLITYMRTDSIRVSDDAKQQAKKFIEENYGKEYVGNYYVTNKSKNIQDAHEGIRPTYVELTPEDIKGSLTNDEYKLYKLIWDRFIVSQFASVKYDQLQIKAEYREYKFKGTLNKITFDGYYKIYKDEDAISTFNFPSLDMNKEYKIDELITKNGETKPPTRYSEATLIKKLESLGIGRPSTYASIIEAIKSKNYVDVVEKRLMPTSFGKEVKQELDKNFKKIMNVKFTAEMENSLDEVANGKLNWIELLKSFYEKLEIEMKKYKEIQEDIKNKIIYTDMPCSDGNGKMLLKTGNFGKYLVCEFNSKDKISISGIEINDDDIKNDFVEIKDKVEVLLENKKGYKTDVFTENGKMYLLKNGRFGEYLESEDYENDNLRKPLSKEIRAKLKKSSIAVENGILKLNDILQENQNKDNEILENAGKCEKCGRDFVIKTGRYGKFLACSGYPECSNIKRIAKTATTKTKRKTTSTKKK
ncbi:type I DNA topoisomerase [Pseudostreptobacillus hongkongensis]|uniref:type I DNA topoisomerase n=1 Tax=Pseudostreptobacillus hongkongensis TaxID=1162717 RepID=UPI000830AFE2|nr:type I DNA topoisomerase [Pseudostreptobacillus hongkongensis]